MGVSVDLIHEPPDGNRKSVYIGYNLTTVIFFFPWHTTFQYTYVIYKILHYEQGEFIIPDSANHNQERTVVKYY